MDIQVAGLPLRIGTYYDTAYRLCRPFACVPYPITDASLSRMFPALQPPIGDFASDQIPHSGSNSMPTFVCTRADIDYEVAIYAATRGNDIPNEKHVEVAALLRKVSNYLLGHDAFVLHGAAVAVGDEAFLFTGPSGTGKTTHIRKWLAECPGAYVVNGDKPFIVAREEEKPLACGSPWCGKEEMVTNTMVPLRSVVFMRRSDQNVMRRISFAEAFPKLLEQVHRPKDKALMHQTLVLLQRLASNVSFWDFSFDNFQDDAFEVAHDALCN